VIRLIARFRSCFWSVVEFLILFLLSAIVTAIAILAALFSWQIEAKIGTILALILGLAITYILSWLSYSQFDVPHPTRRVFTGMVIAVVAFDIWFLCRYAGSVTPFVLIAIGVATSQLITYLAYLWRRGA